MKDSIINKNDKRQWHGYQEWYSNLFLYKMNKDIINKNDKGLYHGYQEWYIDDWNKLLYRANFKNGNIIGYLENHNIKQTIFHIK